MFNKLVEEKSSEFRNLERRSNPDDLIQKHKTEGRILKDFRNYQNPIELFKDLRDGNINPRQVLRDQINFKSDLSEIKKNPKPKSKDQISVIQNVENSFDFREKVIDSLQIVLFYYLILNIKQSMERTENVNY